MDIRKISPGSNAPEEINVVIEIPGGSSPVKYEFDKESGALFVDRFMQVSMNYPCNYGFIPNTQAGDGDPCDVLVLVDMPVVPGCVIRARPIGVLIMEDEAGNDEKILAVPIEKEHPYYTDIKSYTDLPEIILHKIKHFFENYKSLEEGKWVKVNGWEGVEKAKQLIIDSIEKVKET